MKFNVGDIVKCIDNDGVIDFLKHGQQYEITRVWKEYGTVFVDIRKLGSKKSVGGFYPSRFELVTRKQTNVNTY